MKINIYYGGRGELDDPTLYVLEKMTSVLSELRVEVMRYNIFEYKNQISTLSQTLKDADGIILATTVEWYGIGGYMMTFLDTLWLYADKEIINSLYMQPVVLSTTVGERESMLYLENAWETLGGQLAEGLCGYVEDPARFKTNKEYGAIIEKKAEALYRIVSQKTKGLPTSSFAVTKTVLRTQHMSLTPEENEQLSQYASDDSYVKKQKEDIRELSSMYRNLLGSEKSETDEYFNDFRRAFSPQDTRAVSYFLEIDGNKKSILINIYGNKLELKYVKSSYDEKTDVHIKLTENVLSEIVSGRKTMQRAFSTGDASANGNFSLIGKFDKYFGFIK